MHPNPRRIVPIVLLLIVLAVLGYWYFALRPQQSADGKLTASGTIEVVQIQIAPEAGGKVIDVFKNEGDAVKAGEPLVQLDTALLEAQKAQAEAALAVAKANAEAAVSNIEAIGAAAKAAASAELAAQAAVDAAQANLDLLSAAATPQQIAAARTQLDQAEANLEAAKANNEAAQIRVKTAEFQADAAQAQVEAAQAAMDTVDVQIAKMTILAPSGGIVLTRTIEPGEIAAPGATLLTLARIDDMTITVYIPEDRYGEVSLGQSAEVRVDSFPNDTFIAEVIYISDRAEFTPRNVQTVEGRKTTVFAVKLRLTDPSGRLKAGMPADVVFK